MDEIGRQPNTIILDAELGSGSMEETLIMSQGTMESMLNSVGANSIDINNLLFKTEILSDCFQQETFHLNPLEHQIPQINQFAALPDSTESPVELVSTSALPSTEDYSGPLNFEVELNKTDDKAKWQYSKPLNKLFVNMNGKIPFSFKWDQFECDLFVRVLPIFLAQDSFSEPVRRCPTHVSTSESTNKDFVYVDHVIRCDHISTLYQKNPNTERLSILVPLEHPQPGTDWSTLIFSFMCKNSCGLGMNRRSTAVIFTLERINGEVIGRKVINFRICSCPRRDMVKEEQDFRMKQQELPQEEPLDSEKIKVLSINKKPLKRLINFQIRVPKSYTKSFAKIIKETVLMNENDRELTPEEKITVEDCNKYIY